MEVRPDQIFIYLVCKIGSSIIPKNGGQEIVCKDGVVRHPHWLYNDRYTFASYYALDAYAQGTLIRGLAIIYTCKP